MAQLNLGVTGLRESGKTVFISALVNMLKNYKECKCNRIQCIKDKRYIKADVANNAPLKSLAFDDVVEFDYRGHLDRILKDREWPERTEEFSALRLVIEYESELKFITKFKKKKTLNIDILDYPGEWLLDLPLLDKSYQVFSADSIKLSNDKQRKDIAKEWHEILDKVDANSKYDSGIARELVEKFREYILKCRDSEEIISRIPPGRFARAKEEGKENRYAMHFAPLHAGKNTKFAADSFGKRFEDNFDRYKKKYIQPLEKFISRLDRQIILVDALPAIIAGQDTFDDFRHSLSDVLDYFKFGKSTLWDVIRFKHKIDRVLIAGSKADHIFKSEHKKYLNYLKKLSDNFDLETNGNRPDIEFEVISSFRSTKELIRKDGKRCLRGIPVEHEIIGGEVFDGKKEKDIRPPTLLSPNDTIKEQTYQSRFTKFRPLVESTSNGKNNKFPHIRLDRAIEILIGDKLK